MKKIILIIAAFLFVTIAVPITIGIVSATVDGETSELKVASHTPLNEAIRSDFEVTVYRTESSTFETMGLETYIIGVVAAEMPALFHIEALKAQAVAARTYALRILQHHNYMLDTVDHQVFLDNDQLKARWGGDFDRHFETIESAVMATQGLVLKYSGDLITPMFFAMSNGATENSEDVFLNARPYLRSVASIGYENRDNFTYDAAFLLEDLRLAFSEPDLTFEQLNITRLSEGGNVLEITVGSQAFTGRDVREILGLRSAAFTMSQAGTQIVFTTYGHGHGVGMSQFGANEMANRGYTFDEILKHFYQNVTLEEKR